MEDRWERERKEAVRVDRAKGVGQRERGKWGERRTDRERKEDEEIWEGKLERGEGVG